MLDKIKTWLTVGLGLLVYVLMKIINSKNTKLEQADRIIAKQKEVNEESQKVIDDVKDVEKIKDDISSKSSSDIRDELRKYSRDN